MEMKLHCFFVLSLPPHLTLSILRLGWRVFALHLLQMEIYAKLMHGDIILFP